MRDIIDQIPDIEELRVAEQAAIESGDIVKHSLSRSLIGRTYIQTLAYPILRNAKYAAKEAASPDEARTALQEKYKLGFVKEGFTGSLIDIAAEHGLYFPEHALNIVLKETAENREHFFGGDLLNDWQALSFEEGANERYMKANPFYEPGLENVVKKPIGWEHRMVDPSEIRAAKHFSRANFLFGVKAYMHSRDNPDRFSQPLSPEGIEYGDKLVTYMMAHMMRPKHFDKLNQVPSFLNQNL